ncbi:D-alanyl-D-alanine carboxypeptidase, partial [Candidatus Wolfebacteria bacterium]|nr:D-alanyl-D-alanine carboxypeptidase [Candidatus Wolfebacteria bacterium]
ASANVSDSLVKATNEPAPLPPIADYCDPIDSSNLTGRATLAKYLNYNLPVFEKNTEKRWPIASITKLMTSVITLEEMNPDEKITISQKAVNIEGVAGGLKAGEVFSSYDLVKAMLVVSSNDAAFALAESMGEKEFVNSMQRKAAELEMLQTTYVEPTGLSFVNQSTAEDLNKLINYIYKNHPEILKISRERETNMTELKSQKIRILYNVDYFAGQKDFIGGKTGFIDAAGRNLVALFNIQDQVVLTIVLGTNNAFEETKRVKNYVQYCDQPKQWFWKYQIQNPSATSTI